MIVELTFKQRLVKMLSALKHRIVRVQLQRKLQRLSLSRKQPVYMILPCVLAVISVWTKMQ